MTPPPRAGPDGTMDLHVFLYDGIVRDKDPDLKYARRPRRCP